jgi:hypothetical protein
MQRRRVGAVSARLEDAQKSSPPGTRHGMPVKELDGPAGWDLMGYAAEQAKEPDPPRRRRRSLLHGCYIGRSR